MLPSHVAAEQGQFGALKILADLANRNVLDNQGRHMGHCACLSGSIDCVHWLLSNYIDISQTDGE